MVDVTLTYNTCTITGGGGGWSGIDTVIEG